MGSFFTEKKYGKSVPLFRVLFEQVRKKEERDIKVLEGKDGGKKK